MKALTQRGLSSGDSLRSRFFRRSMAVVGSLLGALPSPAALRGSVARLLRFA
jgi:hypothetical protein